MSKNKKQKKIEKKAGKKIAAIVSSAFRQLAAIRAEAMRLNKPIPRPGSFSPGAPNKQPAIVNEKGGEVFVGGRASGKSEAVAKAFEALKKANESTNHSPEDFLKLRTRPEERVPKIFFGPCGGIVPPEDFVPSISKEAEYLKQGTWKYPMPVEPRESGLQVFKRRASGYWANAVYPTWKERNAYKTRGHFKKDELAARSIPNCFAY